MIRIEHLSRVFVLQALYQSNITNLSLEDSYDLMLDLLNEEIELSFEEKYENVVFPNIINSVQSNTSNMNSLLLYCKKLILGISEKKEEFIDFLNNNDKSISLDRLNIPLLSILFLAMYEIKFVEEVDYKVAINEALELCNIYAEDSLKPYLNSVLQAFLDNDLRL